MRSFAILALLAALALVGYGIHRNPRACEKLALDVMSDALAIYVTPANSDKITSDDGNSSPDAAPISGSPVSAQTLFPAQSASTAPSVPVVTPAAAAPSLAPAVTPVSSVSPSAVAVPATAPASEPTKPQYSVGYVATLPAAQPPGPTPLAAAQPQRAAQYPAYTDYESGLEAARKYHVPMLVLFTGSDWCHYCQMLEQEVLSTNDFTNYTGSHFVFVTIDDLRNSPVTDSDKARISALEQKYGITGFPTLMVVDSSEHEIGRQEGYDPGSGPKAVIQTLNQYAAR